MPTHQHRRVALVGLTPKVEHLAASGRATPACPLDGHDAAPATRPEASAPAAAAHGICPTRADSLRFCQNFQNQWVALVEVAAERLRAGRCQPVAKNAAPRGTMRHSDPIKTPQFARIQPDGGRGAV